MLENRAGLQWMFIPFTMQQLQRSNHAFNGFPAGEAMAASYVVATYWVTYWPCEDTTGV